MLSEGSSDPGPLSVSFVSFHRGLNSQRAGSTSRNGDGRAGQGHRYKASDNETKRLYLRGMDIRNPFGYRGSTTGVGGTYWPTFSWSTLSNEIKKRHFAERAIIMIAFDCEAGPSNTDVESWRSYYRLLQTGLRINTSISVALAAVPALLLPRQLDVSFFNAEITRNDAFIVYELGGCQRFDSFIDSGI